MRDRFSPVLEPDFKSCKPPFSFYRLIDKYWPGKGAKRTFHRIFSLMRKMNVQTVAVEELARKGELDEEATAIEVRCQGPVRFAAWRFSFFTSKVPSFDCVPYVRDAEYLGYAVLISMRLPNGNYARYVYESVIVEPAFHTDDVAPFGSSLPGRYIHCVRRYSGWVGGHRFRLTGSFFSQQNGLTHVCAHAALRWLLNNLPERAERIISYEDINRDLQIDHSRRKVGRYGDDVQAEGLPMDDLLMVLDKRGYKCFDVNFESTVGTPQPYWRFIYSIIESGYPALVFFTAPPARHVICAIGHSFNSDIWDAEAKLAYSGAPRMEYLSSASWVDHFIIHDDNYGMYFSMPSKALSPTTQYGGPFQVTGALGVVPTEIDLNPLWAEFLASIALRLAIYQAPWRMDHFWLKALHEEDVAFGKWVVLRTLLSNKAAYTRHLSDIEDVEGNFLTKDEIKTFVHEEIPEHFWITEFTLADLYTANKRKLGEVLFRLSDPQITSEDSGETFTRKLFSACIGLRLPGNILIPQVGQQQTLLRRRETNLTGHVPLLRPCRPAPPFEW